MSCELLETLVEGLAARSRLVLKDGNGGRYMVYANPDHAMQQIYIHVKFPFYGSLVLAKIDVDDQDADVGLGLNRKINWRTVRKFKNPDMRYPAPCRISLSRPDFFDLFDAWLQDLDYIEEPADAKHEPHYKSGNGIGDPQGGPAG